MQGLDSAQMNVAEAANYPGRDFVSDLVSKSEVKGDSSGTMTSGRPGMINLL